MYYQLGRAGKALDRFGVIEFATTIAPGRPRRAADRQGLRGGPAQRAQQGRPARTTRSCSTRRRPGGSPSSSTSTTSSPGWPRSGPIKQPGRHGDDAAPLAAAPPCTWSPCWRRCRCRRPPTASPSCAAHGLPVGGVVVNLVRPRDLDDRRARRRGRGRAPSTGRRWPPTWSGPGSTPTTRWSTGLLAEARDHAERRDARGRAARAGRASSTCPTYELPRLAGGIDLGGALRARRRRCCRAGHGMTREPARARVGPPASARGPTAPPRLDVDALLDDPATGIIVCCGSGGVGKTTTSAALALRAAERGRKVVVLTIDPARRLAQSMGIEELDNTPRPVAGRRRGTAGGSPRRDDARHEAHLRRGGARARPAPRRPRRSWRTRSTSRCRARSRAPRSTWRWRSSASSTPTPSATGTLRPDRGRHPAVAVGAGLPRRPRAALELPRRPVHPAAAGARPAARPG